MKKYITTALILISLCTNNVFAQDFFDAIKYSQTEYGGTARSIAMGSAFGSLGGDFISASINPAGLGFYRSGEFVFSPTLNINQIGATYLGNKEIENNTTFNFNNTSWITSTNTGATSGILNVTFGIGYNRLKSFNSNTYIQGFDAKTTLLNYYSDYANQIGNDDYFDYHYEGLAWNTWLIDVDNNAIENQYIHDLGIYDYYDVYDDNGSFIGVGNVMTDVHPHQQKSIISKTGHIDEYLMSLGFNVNHKVYIGASLGLLDLTYKESIMFSEIDNKNASPFLNSYSQVTDLYDDGFGVNFKAGIIVRPSKSLRLGLAVHTPNFYNISRYDNKEITANYDQEIGNDEFGYDVKYNEKNDMYFDYKLETPYKVNISGSYMIGDMAIVSLDYELINYIGAKFRDAGDNYDYSDKNSEISHTLKSTGNIRVGTEYRATPNFSVRAGYNLFGNPWQSSFTYSDGTKGEILNKKDTYSSYSAGVGYRQNNFFIDFAYRLSSINYVQQVHEIYTTNPSGGNAMADLKELGQQATVTLGLRF